VPARAQRYGLQPAQRCRARWRSPSSLRSSARRIAPNAMRRPRMSTPIGAGCRSEHLVVCLSGLGGPPQIRAVTRARSAAQCRGSGARRRHLQQAAAAQPLLADAAGEWFRDIVRAAFGSLDKATGDAGCRRSSRWCRRRTPRLPAARPAQRVDEVIIQVSDNSRRWGTARRKPPSPYSCSVSPARS
jgi:hypothetical protein